MMLNHDSGADHIESPARIKAAYSAIRNSELFKKCRPLGSRCSGKQELLLVHNREHVDLIENVSSKELCEREQLAGSYDSVTFTEGVSQAASLAAGCVVKIKKNSVQLDVLISLASMADLCKEDCHTHYDSVIPLLKARLINGNDKSSHMLCHKSMERIRLFITDVGKKKFIKDAKQVTETLATLRGVHLEAEGSPTKYMLQELTRLSAFLDEDISDHNSDVSLLSAEHRDNTKKPKR